MAAIFFCELLAVGGAVSNPYRDKDNEDAVSAATNSYGQFQEAVADALREKDSGLVPPAPPPPGLANPATRAAISIRLGSITRSDCIGSSPRRRT
jgi:hypothetical protein